MRARTLRLTSLLTNWTCKVEEVAPERGVGLD